MCTNEVETEVHFLIDCHLHDHIRQPLMDLCTLNIPDFDAMSSAIKYCNIMNCNDVTRQLSKTLVKMIINRRSFIT